MSDSMFSKAMKLDVSENTQMVNWPTWAKNSGDNFNKIRIAEDGAQHLIKTFQKYKGKAAVIIGAGPSVKEHHHLELLKENLDKGADLVIFATDRMLKPCLEIGIVPQFVLTVDASIEISQLFYDHDIVREKSENIVGLFNIFTNPEVFRHFNGKKRFFISAVDRIDAPVSVTRFLNYFFSCPILCPMGDVGSTAWTAAVEMGCDPIVLIGLDYGEKKIEDLGFYQNYVRDVPEERRDVDKYFKFFDHPVWGTRSATDITWEYTFGTFAQVLKMFKEKRGTNTISCVEGGCLVSDGLTYQRFQDFLSEYWEKKGVVSDVLP